MELIFIAALCSVAVSILLKLAKRRQLSPIHMISWNYVTASLLCFFWFKPDIQHISIRQTPWWLILALGILLPSVFLFLAKSLRTAGILKTEIAQRLSVVLSLAAAYFIFQEQFNQLKILGIILGIVSVLCILLSHGQGAGSSRQGVLYLALVWFGYALIDVLLKYTTSLGLQFAVALNLMFICALVVSMAYLMVKYRSLGSAQEIGVGLFLGLLNFANIAFYVQAHILLKDTPAIVFAGMNILVVVFGVLAGLVFFKERLKPASTIGLILGVISVICLAYAMSA
ncbi:DMT family transporter [Acinetobacter bohemicus]|uniref:DMT family transporter n=1 Tax=Acinetobacter TaxID=469 RepID=UPI00157BD6E3|nr:MULTISPECIES: DMT family transporter [Acinetobacter]MCO8041785.1 DMT family transporter [Acinetobacter sp. S4400-12]MCU7223802.1 DMT family transporter [Acinetobacter bohemicus]MDM1781818.1 DMT family transporter [Acinetobacter indicus]QKQ69833.1 DMT family transporter [Acinetobacter sp. 10FS3-1]